MKSQSLANKHQVFAIQNLKILFFLGGNEPTNTYHINIKKINPPGVSPLLVLAAVADASTGGLEALINPSVTLLEDGRLIVAARLHRRLVEELVGVVGEGFTVSQFH